MEVNNRVLLVIAILCLALSFSSDALRVPRGHRLRHRVPRFVRDDPAINRICAAARDPILCKSSITPFLDGKNDPAGVLIKEIKATNRSLEAAVAKAKNLLRIPSNRGQAMSQSLNDCIESYEHSIYDLKSIVKEITAHDYRTVDSILTAVLGATSDCSDVFKEFGLNSPLAGVNAITRKLAFNCHAINQRFFLKI